MPQSTNPGAVIKKIRRYFQNEKAIFDRMEEDHDKYWALEEYLPPEDDNILPEDWYTTNQPKVLAQKIIAFIAETEMVIRVPNDNAPKDQEERNKATEQLGIGMLGNVDRRKRRNGEPRVQRQMAFHSVVRGRYVAARAFLRKRENGDTYEDILPIDPAQLVFQAGEEEPIWAAHRIQKSRAEVRDELPNFKFPNETEDDGDEEVEVFDYFVREDNPNFNINSNFSFDAHPYIYQMGTIINDTWARPLRNIFTLHFPIIISPVDSQPKLTPPSDRSVEKHSRYIAGFGESIFAENRQVWDMMNRTASTIIDMVGKSSDPGKKVYSSDGTKEIEEGSNEQGAQIRLSVGDQQDVQLMETPDVNRSAGFLLELLQRDIVGGGLPPQAFGLLDKPLSAVALRQLGNNLEHRVLPRMEAVQLCIEGCLEVLIAQYETGAFDPITVSGQRFDRHRFSNQEVTPEEIFGHDAVTVSLELVLPEDETIRWNVANMAMQPTVTGEPLTSLEYVREHILKIQDPKLLGDQNREVLTRQTSPVLNLLDQYRAAVRDGDTMAATAIFDQIRLMTMQLEVQGTMQIMQLEQMMQQVNQARSGMPTDLTFTSKTVNPSFAGPDTNTVQQDSVSFGGMNMGSGQMNNPAFGAPPATLFTGQGNTPSPEAGANTTAPRQRQGSGLVDPNGNILGAL
tara:strand:- start:20801 stop:22843 length:2043 start_codon:yes stop_codon:yes gene_type:complete